jgi:hypothetical protein
VRTECYNDFWRPQGFRDLQGVMLLRNARWAASLAMFGPNGREFDEASRAKLNAIAPHVRRALELGFSFEAAVGEESALQTATQMRVVGWVRVDRERFVLEEQEAQVLRGAGSPLGIVSGKLCARDPEDARRLAEAVRSAAAGTATTFVLGKGALSLSIGVAPGPRRSPFEAERCVTVLFAPAPSPLTSDPFAELPTSLRTVAERLAQGLSDKEIAAELETPLATVRTYATRVYERLGVHGRRELMRMYGPQR